jgi:phage tail sheath protein FI
MVYETPGVYYERVDARTPAIAAIRTDVAGFVGIASRGPVGEALPVESFRQFQAHYGGFSGAGYLAYAVRGFFENGGRRCWIVRVASNEPGGAAAAAEAVVPSTASPPADVWRIRASSPGVWGNNLTVRLTETHQAQTRSLPSQSPPESSRVDSTAGFRRGTLVRVSQPGVAPQLKVVSAVDAVEGLLMWVNPREEYRLASDSPLSGFNPDSPVLIESVEYTLLVRQSGVPVFLREGLSLVPEHPGYGPSVLPPLVNPADLEARRVLPPTPNPVTIEEARTEFLPLAALDVSAGSVRLAGGADGLARLVADDFIGEPVSPTDSDEARAAKQRGLQALAPVEDVSMIAVPDIHIRPVEAPPSSPPPPCVPDPCLPVEVTPAESFREEVSTELPPVFGDADVYRVQAAMIQMCEDRRDRIAILDAPYTAACNDEQGPALIRAWRSRFDSKYGALYHPWLRVSDPLRTESGLTRDIPPSGHVAGQYAATDLEVGVHKAPANAPLVWTQDVTAAVSEAGHGLLNTLGVNLIKPLAGRGTRIMGARTVSSDPDWRFVNVRRLLMMIEKAIFLSTQWAAFEPNDWATRAKIRLSLSSFLAALWQRGALAGAAAEEAFFVKCDEDNNPARERDNGRLLAEVGVAPSNPFEFVVLRVGRQGNEFEIQEAQVIGGR